MSVLFVFILHICFLILDFVPLLLTSMYFKCIGGVLLSKQLHARDESDSNMNDYIPIIKLEKYFDSKMKNPNIPLLKDFQSYERSLPVRETKKENLRLCKLPFFAADGELNNMAEAIMYPPQDMRNFVSYIAGPTAAGKSSSVLPAFLESACSSHSSSDSDCSAASSYYYLYLPFDNNAGRKFTANPRQPNHDPNIARRQGAAFIVSSVEILLQDPDNIKKYTIPLEENPPTLQESLEKLQWLFLSTSFPVGSTVWLHVDEHAKMCDRWDYMDAMGANFSRGAMETTLASIPNAYVIATYIDRPSGVPAPGSSSGVSRNPIPLVQMKVDLLFKSIPELNIISQWSHEKYDTLNNAEAKRLLTSLKFRLVAKLRELGIVSVLHRRSSNPIAERFLRDFEKNAIEAPDVVTALRLCNRLCVIKLPSVVTDDVDAAKLLVGVKDDIVSSRRLPGLITLPDGLLTVSLNNLLAMDDPGCVLYSQGKDLFEQCILAPDLLASSPLEASYRWVLACRSSVTGRLIFNQSVFKIQCSKLIPGRIFASVDSSDYNLEALEANVLYYAQEKKEVPY